MDIEDRIILDRYVTNHQRQIVQHLPPLHPRVLANFICDGSPTDVHCALAVEIIENRENTYGWKDYMYCCICTMPNIGVHIAQYASANTQNQIDAVELFVCLFYSATMVLACGNREPAWKYFSEGIWKNVSVTNVKSMICARILDTDVHIALGIDASNSRVLLNKATRKLFEGSIGAALCVSNFMENCDKRTGVFAMPTMVYDIRREILRKGLPSDLATLRGEVDPDVNSWQRNREAMLEIFTTWMSERDVAETYLDALGAAISEFKPRYAFVNSGTGSDGKSTFSHIVKNVFGGYCVTLPSKGLMVDAKNSNDATPIINSLVNKRVCIVPDAFDVVRMIESSTFKSISGGDEIYRRGLYQESTENISRLKLLAIVNTNQASIVVTGIASLTRIKAVRWLRKTIREEDVSLIPQHQILNSSIGKFSYEDEFLQKYGSCLMFELLYRNAHIKRREYQIHISDTIKQWTREMVSPKTILTFLHTCTEKISLQQSPNQLVPYDNDPKELTVEELFLIYATWRKGGARLSNTDPTNLQAFTCHLEFYHPIVAKRTSDGLDIYYVEGLRLKPEYSMIGTMFSSFHNDGNFMSGTLMAPVIELQRMGTQ